MKIVAVILSHYKEREGNLKTIIDDLLGGTVVPREIIIFIDNPDIAFTDNRVTVIRSSRSFLPIIRFAIGSIVDADYCFFIDDDLSVSKKRALVKGTLQGTFMTEISCGCLTIGERM